MPLKFYTSIANGLKPTVKFFFFWGGGGAIPTVAEAMGKNWEGTFLSPPSVILNRVNMRSMTTDDGDTWRRYGDFVQEGIFLNNSSVKRFWKCLLQPQICPRSSGIKHFPQWRKHFVFYRVINSVDTWRKWNVYKTLNSGPVSRGKISYLNYILVL